MSLKRTQMHTAVQRYLKGLDDSNLEEVLDLFSEDAMVVSPIYGKRAARDFYQALFDDTFSSNTSLLQTVIDELEGTMVLIFSYQWKLKDDRFLDFEVADFIHFDENGLIKQLSIFYDTFPLRGTS